MLKHLLAFRHVGNVILNRPAEPIANTKVNLDPFPLAHLARKCYSLPLPQCECGLLGKGGVALSPLSAVGFWLFPPSTQQCSAPRLSAKGDSFSLSSIHLTLQLHNCQIWCIHHESNQVPGKTIQSGAVICRAADFHFKITLEQLNFQLLFVLLANALL